MTTHHGEQGTDGRICLPQTIPEFPIRYLQKESSSLRKRRKELCKTRSMEAYFFSTIGRFAANCKFSSMSTRSSTCTKRAADFGVRALDIFLKYFSRRSMRFFCNAKLRSARDCTCWSVRLL